MSSKEKMCVCCGHWRSDGSYVDLDDELGTLWTCPDCVKIILAGREKAQNV